MSAIGQPLFYLDRWIEEEPESAEAYQWRGWVYERMNSSERATQDYQRSVELGPERDAARLRLAEILLEKSDPQSAIEHLQRLRQQFPDRPDIAARLGYCRYLQGRLDEARELLESAVPELPNDQSALIHLAKVDLQENRPAKAEVLGDGVLNLDSTNTEARFTLATSLRRQGRLRESEKELAQHKEDQQMLRQTSRLLLEEAERPGGNANDLFKIASVFLRSGQDRLALYWLDQALKLEPDHQPTHRALAEYYEKKGEVAKAAVHRRQFKK